MAMIRKYLPCYALEKKLSWYMKCMQIIDTECVNDANLYRDLGNSLEIESSTEHLHRNTLEQKSENLANVVQKIIDVKM